MASTLKTPLSRLIKASSKFENISTANFSYKTSPQPLHLQHANHRKKLGWWKDSRLRGVEPPPQHCSSGDTAPLRLCYETESSDNPPMKNNWTIVQTGTNDAHQRRVSPNYPRSEISFKKQKGDEKATPKSAERGESRRSMPLGTLSKLLRQSRFP